MVTKIDYLQDITIPNEHLCRDDAPIETLIYDLVGTDKNLTKFRGAVRIEQNLEVENSSQKTTEAENCSQNSEGRQRITFTVIYPNEDDMTMVG